MMDPIALKESPPPQDVPAVSTTPDIDAESKGKKARTTVILREVEPAATEELILALFNGTELKVVSARMDVQNTWFVQMETEEMAKQAIPHLSQQILCDKPVKARIKSEGLRTTAQPWQPPAQSMANFAGYGTQQAYAAAGGMPGQYGGGGWGMKPASINRPPQTGGFKKTAGKGEGAPFVPAEGGVTEGGDQGQQMGGRGPRRQPGTGSNHLGRSGQGGERKGRKPAGQTAEPKVPVFQPQDFPSLGGEERASAAAAAAAQQEEEASVAAPQAPVPEAPANSWAARAKTAADVAAPAVVAAPVATAAPAKKKDTSASAKPKREAEASPAAAPVQAESETGKTVEPAKSEVAAAVAAPAESKKHDAPVESKLSAAAAEARAAEIKRRGWEKPELAVKKESPQTSQATSPAPVAQQPAATATSAPATESKEKPAKAEGKKGAQQGKRSQEKEANGHVSPIVPLPWATKSFAQVIKEKAAAPQQPTAAAMTQSATAAGQNVTTLLPAALKSNERWEDMEDDAPTASASSGGEDSRRAAGKQTAAAGTGARMEKLDKLKQSSEMSDDWRRDAAARRKEFEQQPRSGSGDRRRPNASS